MILVAGVNGTGKTTTLGKLAWHLSRELDRSVVLAAGDTFRAAAVEQLEIWAQRAEVGFVKGGLGADSASVAFDAIEQGRRQGADVVLIDTAGRLHTQDNLMSELTKVRRRDRQADSRGAARDAVDGRRDHRPERAAPGELFSEAIDVSGIVLTKLDGTAKGGIALAIASELGIPVKLIGVGEQLEDLRPFDAGEFARALVSLSARARLDSMSMFESLGEKLQATLSDVRGRGTLTEDDINAAMREIRLALLEADVNFKVVRSFTSSVKEKALGADIVGALNPGQQVVKIVSDELTELMGGAARETWRSRRVRRRSC